MRQKDDLVNELGHLFSRMSSGINNKIKTLNKELFRFQDAYVLKYPLNFIQLSLQRIDELSHRLNQGTVHILKPLNTGGLVRKVDIEADVSSFAAATTT